MDIKGVEERKYLSRQCTRCTKRIFM